MALAGAGADFLMELPDGPERAIDRLRVLVAPGEFTVDQVLDEATDTAMLLGLLMLREAQDELDPSMAAEKCLVASRHFVLAVSVASADAEEAIG
ncbi:hypothetical protein ACFYOD_33550 [Streptomyces sp. NPDC006703]|uniref:hypothetical protein n=1 Tax=Streptomyces sp. NPDC006703 TaxID=3364759 RepID=UPI00369BB595